VRVFLLIITCFILQGCFKKTDVSGVVYSKNNIPVPNVYVSCEGYGESSYWETKSYDVAKTDNNGFYQFRFTAQKKYRYKVVCDSDSGLGYRGINYGKVNHLDIHLK